jgi:CRP-like cAMP-binding protein
LRGLKSWPAKEVAVESALKGAALDRLIKPHLGGAKSKRLVYSKGEYIFLPGDPSDTVYLITKGRVKLSYPAPGGEGGPLTLSVLGEGELFGEMALVGAERRELMAQALERTSIWAIEKESFLRLLRGSPSLALQVMELFIRRLRLLEERMLELFFHDPLARLALLLGQDSQEEEIPLQESELLRLLRVAMAGRTIATPLPQSCPSED